MVDTLELKAAMVKKGYTQDRLAKEIGMATKTLNQKISNKWVFGIDEAKKIADILQLENPATIFFAN